MTRHAGRPLHADFGALLSAKHPDLVALFMDLRRYVLSLRPASNELLYHTHALTCVFSISGKLGDAYCMIPVYTKHLHLGFNKGTLLPDPHGLLTGTGTLIRHVPVAQPSDYRNPRVTALLQAAASHSEGDRDDASGTVGQVISKITKR